MKRTPNRDVAGFQHIDVGSLKLTVVSDGYAGFAPTLYAVNAPEDDINALMVANSLPKDVVASVANTLLIDNGGQLTLVDTGWGSFTMGDDTPMNAGKMLNTLKLLGVEPSAIDNVILTHFHPDHISAASVDGKPTFPNAQYFLPKAEQDFLSQGPTGTPLDPFIELANAKLQPMRDNDQMRLFKDEDEVVPGVQAIFTPGHTPGHHSLMIASDGEQFLNMVDIANHFVVSLSDTNYQFGFDAVPEVAVETRQKMLARAADEQLQVMAYHFPFPGIGYIARSGGGYKFVPTL